MTFWLKSPLNIRRRLPIADQLPIGSSSFIGGFMKVIFFSNGNTICFDEKGEQVPELQKSWFLLYAQFLESKGIDVQNIEYQLPSGGYAKIFKTSIGYNWEVI
jgi:hypothetical protein